MTFKKISTKAKKFERMALKDKLLLNKKINSINLLSEELLKNQTTKVKLENLLNEGKDNISDTSGIKLHSQSWMNNRLRDELEVVSNKCDHIQDEIINVKKDFAIANRRFEKKNEKAKNLFGEAKNKKIEFDDNELLNMRNRRINN